MDKSKIYLDLSKCTEGERAATRKLLYEKREYVPYFTNLFEIDRYYKLHFDEGDWLCGEVMFNEKTELTYPEFIKLFEGGEEETEVQKLKKQIDLYKECFELFIPIEKWDEANEFLSINKNQLAKHLSRVQKEVEKKPKF